MPATKTNKHKQGTDIAVQGTNDSSVVSKASSAARGYFHDDLLRHFVCKVSRRAPLINRGYYVRWRAVDHCVKRFLDVTGNCSTRQILSLGAGFDSLYFRLHAEGALTNTVVFEVDFPDVARRKAALILGNAALRGRLFPPPPSAAGQGVDRGPVFVSSGQYSLLGVDLRVERQLEEGLSVAGLDWASPTLLLSEVVLTYMETPWSDAVIGWAAKCLPQSLFVMYEQIRPHDPFGVIMREHFLKVNSTLHALQKYPDVPAQRRRFLDQGWDQCVCLDMNAFYLGLVPEEERNRVETLEPFDEFEEWHQKCSHYFILTAWKGSLTSLASLIPPQAMPVSPPVGARALCVRAVPVETRVEGLGMASCCFPGPDLVLLTGGSGGGGRGGSENRVLLIDRTGWTCVTAEAARKWDVRLYHTMTSLPGGGAVVYGGRSSPLKPVRGLLSVTLDPRDPVVLCVTELCCTGPPPQPRWRHTAAVLRHREKDFLFVFGGRNEVELALGDSHFLCLDSQHWTKIPVGGAAPVARHSHSACPYRCGAVLFGGLGVGGAPLGDTLLLRPTDEGFCWGRLQVQPPPVPRYSHSAHVLGDRLILVGGVWLHSDGVPGVAVIDLTTGSSVEFNLDTASVPWPVMLQSFCCELADPQEPSLLLVGGGGNCFSFGTHLNPQPVVVSLRHVLG